MPDKTEYNKILARFDKAFAWFLKPTTTAAQMDKYEPEYIKIIHECALMERAFAAAGYDMSSDEIINGFKGVA